MRTLSRSKPGGTMTDSPHPCPRCQPPSPRYVAIDKATSAREFQISTRPSWSASRANFRYDDGKNCGWPIAPAQEPVSRSRSMRPRATIETVASSSWVKRSRRRPSKASVASDRGTSKLPVTAPKLLSIPQMPRTMAAGTPVDRSLAANSVVNEPRTASPREMRTGSTRRST